MSLFLPTHWVYVLYEDGTCENVANSDTLTKSEAEWFRNQWEKPGKRVKMVALVGDDVIRHYEFK